MNLDVHARGDDPIPRVCVPRRPSLPNKQVRNCGTRRRRACTPPTREDGRSFDVSPSYEYQPILSAVWRVNRTDRVTGVNSNARIGWGTPALVACPHDGIR